MDRMTRLWNFLLRLVKGEDVLLVQQDTSKWDKQFTKGTWDFLMGDHPNTSLIAETILQQISPMKKPLQVVDYGCGNGALAALLESAIERREVQYVGIDISAVAIEQARRRVPSASFSVQTGLEMPGEIASADFLIFNEVLYYANPDDTLPYCMQSAKKDARVIISIIRTWRSPFLWYRIRKYVECTKKLKAYDQNKKQCFDIVIGTLKSVHK